MKKIIGIVFALLLIASCRNKEQLGPTLKVNILQPLAVNTATVDFAAGGKIFFTAVFENSAAWTITITGSNGATKVITGVSKEINAENSTWLGTVDVLPSFIAGTATAVLTFQIDPQTDSVPFTISAKRVSDKATDVLVTDFTSSPVQNYGSTIQPQNWASTYPLTINTNTDYISPDGNPYEFMGDVAPWQGSGSPFVDIVTISARNSQTNYGTYYPILYSDPTQVYFNIMVYGTGTPVWLQFNFFEVEGIDPNATSNPSADRQLTIKPNWTGWKQISVKYSDLVALNTAAATNIQPQKISDIQIVLLSNVSTSNNDALINTSVKTALDHITFTHNTPYQP